MSSPAYSPDFLPPTSLDQNLALTNECGAAQMQAMPLFDQRPHNGGMTTAAPPPTLMTMYPSYYLGGLPTPYFTPQYIVPTVIRTSATPQASSSHHMSAATSAAPLIYAPGHQHQPYFFCAPNVSGQSYGSKMAPHMRHYG
uniref:Uncharacterized protein n=1 Tax=Romanomermis culicivorax TaxID=13658 RepID=A0A915I099_ROMCU